LAGGSDIEGLVAQWRSVEGVQSVNDNNVQNRVCETRYITFEVTGHDSLNKETSTLLLEESLSTLRKISTMDAEKAINALRTGQKVRWPKQSDKPEIAGHLDQYCRENLVDLRREFVNPTTADLKRGKIPDRSKPGVDFSDESIYFCGNSLGLQPEITLQYVLDYLATWRTIGVKAHFSQMENSRLPPFQDMAAECARKSAHIFGADESEIVIMNTLTVNLHLMMAAFYRPTEKRHKIMVEWRPFPSDWV
jgi:kynureninase